MGDDWTMLGDDDVLPVRFSLALDLDVFGNPVGLEPLAPELIVMRVLGVNLFDKEILTIGEGQGHPPSNAGVVPDQHQRHPRKSDTDNVKITGG